MVFQRMAVASGSYLARDSQLFPLERHRISSIADIHSPRTSGRGFRGKELPKDVENLFLVLALCHTVRVERETIDDRRLSMEFTVEETLPSEGRDKKPKKETRKGLLTIADFPAAFRGGLGVFNKKAPPRRQASIMRRASAMYSAEAAMLDVRRGREMSPADYDYQVRIPLHLAVENPPTLPPGGQIFRSTLSTLYGGGRVFSTI